MSVKRCAVFGTFASGEVWSFRQHFDSGASVAAVSADWSGLINTTWTNGTFGLETLYPVGTVVTGTSTAELLGVPFREGLKAVTALAIPGTNVGDGLPEQTCVLVSLRGALVGRAQRGRIHLPAPAEGVAIGGEMGGTETTRVTTAIQNLYGGMRGLGHTPVLYNVEVSVSDPVLQTLKPIVLEETDRVLRTLRARTKRRAAVYM